MFKNKKDKQKKVVMDFDKLVSSDRYFILGGRERKIRSITTKDYLVLVEAFNNLTKTDLTSNDPEVSQKMYLDLFKSVTEDISMADVKKMSISQIAALMYFVMDVISGRDLESEGYEAKKKTLSPENPTASTPFH